MAARKTPSKGSRPDKLMRDAIILALHREANGSDGKPTKKLYLVAEKLVDAALSGDMRAQCEVNDRVDGKSPQALALTDPDGGAMTINIVKFAGSN